MLFPGDTPVQATKASVDAIIKVRVVVLAAVTCRNPSFANLSTSICSFLLCLPRTALKPCAVADLPSPSPLPSPNLHVSDLSGRPSLCPKQPLVISTRRVLGESRVTLVAAFPQLKSHWTRAWRLGKAARRVVLALASPPGLMWTLTWSASTSF
jgi:hypothetical protein